MRDLQAAFEAPPRVRPLLSLPRPSHSAQQYGKSLDWKTERYTTHDVASVFRRYLTQMPVSSARPPVPPFPLSLLRLGTCHST